MNDKNFDQFSLTFSQKYEEVIFGQFPQIRSYLNDVEDGINPLIRLANEYDQDPNKKNELS